ncbi:MAG TPA: hypothetical protein EYQ14_03340, partial [Gammaproteobacteria bacterium]|nr:hypothetical protein [Gammaproteobacteria bacterium]HIL97157.1 hypothetical protein [Pseudomonadales bacterium]
AKGQRYDRGHLVPANHLDYSKKAIKQSNYMTNILPQAANMNRGAVHFAIAQNTLTLWLEIPIIQK